jgi:LysM repeat protein
MDLFFAQNSEQALIKESLQVPKDFPEMDKVYDMLCRPSVMECRIADDRVTVEGVVGCDVIYLARGDERIVHSFSDELPFKTSISLPGCKLGMKSEVDVDVENMEFSLLTKNELEVKIGLGCLVKLFEKISKAFIIKAVEIEGEPPIHKASITIYMVQPKDTLWKVAKRYYTTIEDIVKINDILDPDNISPGMKIIIPKRI